MITLLIKELQSKPHYGVSETIEIAKGKNEYINSWVDFKRKIKRLWLSRRL